MYDLDQTIAAVSSPPAGPAAILRLTGPRTLELCRQIFAPPPTEPARGLFAGEFTIDPDLKIPGTLYLFAAPKSYTGQDLAEIHIRANPAVVEALMANLLAMGARTAGPGEFTARAYLSNKIDLAQAEAVNEIIVSSNTFQLAAAEKLLSGRLAEATAEISSAIMDCLALIEAGLDFTEEDIEFITRKDALDRLAAITAKLRALLAGPIGYESLIDLPAVGIAGAANAGKSSLANKLLGRQRAIVSHERNTTRDVLTGLLDLDRSKCVLFDCAGLTREPRGILAELAQQAAIEALRNSEVIVFCVDIAKDHEQQSTNSKHPTRDPAASAPDTTLWSEETSLWSVVRGLKSEKIIPVATKSDLLAQESLEPRLAILQTLFAAEFSPISATTGLGIAKLRKTIDKNLTAAKKGVRSLLPLEAPAQSNEISFSDAPQGAVALTARHRQAVTEAIENINAAAQQLPAASDEVAAMLLRTAYQNIETIQHTRPTQIDEQILNQIFNKFCIGK